MSRDHEEDKRGKLLPEPSKRGHCALASHSVSFSCETQKLGKLSHKKWGARLVAPIYRQIYRVLTKPVEFYASDIHHKIYGG